MEDLHTSNSTHNLNFWRGNDFCVCVCVCVSSHTFVHAHVLLLPCLQTVDLKRNKIFSLLLRL